MTRSAKKPRESWASRIIRDVKYFHDQTGMKFTTIGIKAINNSRTWDRLNTGGTITLDKADAIYEFMATHGYYFNS